MKSTILAITAGLGLASLTIANPAPTPAPVPATTTSSSDDDSSSDSSRTSSSAATTWTITVGKATNQFTPDVIQADVGDIIEWDFFPPNHSVVRAEYEYPCVPYELTGKGKVGFFSGFKPVDAILNNPPKFSVRVNDSNPVFFYCSAPGSCIDYQMVGVINPVSLARLYVTLHTDDSIKNSSVSLAKQKALAKDASYMLQPGENFPAEASSSMASMASTVTATYSEEYTDGPTTSAAAAAATGGSHSSLSGGAIGGIVVGAVAVLVLAAALFFYIGRNRKMKEQLDNHRASAGPPDIINQGGVLYAPIGTAPKDMRQSGTTAMSDVPSYQQVMKSPTMSTQERMYSPMGTMRSSSPADQTGMHDGPGTPGVVSGEWQSPVARENR